MATFDELSINIGADVADAMAGLTSVESELDNVGGEALTTAQAMGRLASQTEQLGDQMTRTAVKAGTTSAAIAGTGAAASSTAIGFQSLGAVSSTVLLPALAALSTTLIPLTATLTGLASAAGAVAGAFGLVVGSGLIAFGEERGKQNEERLAQVKARIEGLEQLRDEQGKLTEEQEKSLENLKEQKDELEEVTGVAGGLKDAFADLRAELTPIIVSFGQEFTPLIEDALDALPDLAENVLSATGDLTTFRESLRDFGQAAFRIIPDITEELFNLARRALPVVIDTFQWLERNAGGIFDAILRTTRAIAPVLLDFGRVLADIAPTLNSIGVTVLKTVVPALGDFLGAVNKLLQGDIQGGLIEPIKGVINDVVTFLNSEAAQTQIDKASSALFGALATALNNTSESDIAGVSGGLGSALTKAVSNLSENFAESGLATELGILVGDIINVVGKQLRKASNDEEFQKEIAAIGGNIGGALADGIIAATKQSLTDFEVTDLFGGVGFALEGIETPDAPTQQPAQTIPQNPTSSAGVGQPQRFELQNNVTVQLDGQPVRDEAKKVLTEQELATIRGTGGSQRP
jgi:flagellar motility protein MotE (MotC chaperone)